MSSHLPHSQLHDYIKKHGIPDSWSDTAATQASYSLEEKGWAVKVAFKKCLYGLGLFADQDISKGNIIRKSEIGKTLAVLYEKDFENFPEKTIEYISHYATDHIGNNSVQINIPGSGINHSRNNNVVVIHSGSRAI